MNPPTSPLSADILMITHKRPQYVELSLPRLIESLDDSSKLWLWHNGTDAETLEVVSRYADHPRVARFHHSTENAGIRTPTNWMWDKSTADLVSKVDDDCLVDPLWINRLRDAHAGAPEAGIIGSWRFYDEDFQPADAAKKIRTLANRVQVMQNHWVQGSGYLAKREIRALIGGISDDETFNDWCIRAAQIGYVNGWLFPFVHEEHMDDPRSPWTLFTDDDVFMANRPLSAIQTGVTTTEGWTRQMQRSARTLQSASLDLRHYRGWRRKVLNLRIRASDLWLRNRNSSPLRRG